MSTSRKWTIEVILTEDPTTTRAEVRLDAGDRAFRGVGHARRNPADPNVPRIGEELATARALSDLSHQLVHVAADEIEAFEGHSVTLRG